jgi:hypothetical protein
MDIEGRYLGSSLQATVAYKSYRRGKKIFKREGETKETRGNFIICNIQHTQFGKHLLFSDLVLIYIVIL